MGKAVLISIRPKWCELIANGKKTVEVRKNSPKLKTPFKCYIYCTKPSKRHQTICGCMVLNNDELFRHPRKGIKYGDSIELMCEDDYSADNFLNGKVIGEFTCRTIEEFDSAWSEYAYAVAPPGSVMPMHEETALRIMTEKGCLTYDDITEYFGDADYKASFWHISDLVIYDKPKKLDEFRRPCQESLYCESCAMWNNFGEWCGNAALQITSPPQSWCYVEQEG